MTSVISNAHQHGTRVVLTVSVFAWTTEPGQRPARHPRQRGGTRRGWPGRSPRRSAIAAPTASTSTSSRSPAATPTSSSRSCGPSAAELNKVRKGYQLTYDTTGFIGNYPIEASVAKGAADAIFIMGYDYRTSSSSTAGSVDPLAGPGYDLADTIRAYTARVSPSRIILGVPWYGRAWSTATNGVRSKNTSGAKFGYSTAVNYETVVDLVKQYGRRWDPVEAQPVCRLPAPELHRVLRLRHQLATGLLRRRGLDEAALRARQRLRPARRRHVGARLSTVARPTLYRAVSESFLVDKSAPQAGIRILGGIAGRRGLHRLVGGTRHELGRLVRRPGLDRRRRAGGRG